MTKLAAGISLSVSLIACGGGDTPAADPTIEPSATLQESTPGQSAAKPACDYATASEVSSIFETEMKVRSDDRGSNCIFDSTTEGAASVDYKITEGTDGYDTVAQNMQPVEGIGDRAAARDDGGFVQLVAAKGDMMVMMTVSGSDVKGGGSLEVAKKLALLIVGRF